MDFRDTCRGYLKTGIGAEDEALLLADGSSLHLDFIAHDGGLVRMASSLYGLHTLVRE